MAFSIDDAWDNSAAVVRAGTPAFGLYCRCGAWAVRNLSDGFVPAEIATAYGTPEWARKLVDVGLWTSVEGGYQMPFFAERNETAEQVRKRRAADAERKARERERRQKMATGQHKQSRRDSRVTHEGVTQRVRGGVRSSFTSSPSGRERAPARAQGAARVPPAHAEQCPLHIGQPRDNCAACASERKGASDDD